MFAWSSFDRIFYLKFLVKCKFGQKERREAVETCDLQLVSMHLFYQLNYSSLNFDRILCKSISKTHLHRSFGCMETH